MAMLDKVPHELRIFTQWVAWKYEETSSGKPTKVPYNARTNRLASVKEPLTWSSYDVAVSAVENMGYDGIGFVLTKEDPFTFIDLDATEDQEINKKQTEIYNAFDSYAEISPSGKGLHIIVKGKVPSGRKRSKIEIYSHSRYMTVTGNVYRNSSINKYNGMLNDLWSQMSYGPSHDIFYAGLSEAKETNAQVLEQMFSAVNGEKAEMLYKGQWEGLYPSQSEADFALIDIIAFYTQNRKQIADIFRKSALGKRDKAKRPDYLSWMLNRAFDNILPPIDIEGLRNKLNEHIDNKPAAIELSARVSPNAIINYSMPPGLVGEIAQYIFDQAPRPVPEIALTGALGLFAGITGRSYNISGTGLNQYLLLLAPTGTGKEAISSGIDNLMDVLVTNVPSALDFIGPSEIASSQAIVKYMSNGGPTSFVSIVGEFGMYLQQMASPTAPAHLLSLRRFLLDAYNKSGEGKVYRPTIYSDKEKNTSSINSPSFSILGESTPEKFYEGLHEGLIAEGLLPRFSILEYSGIRPPLSKTHMNAEPSVAMIERLSDLVAHSLLLNSQSKAVRVGCDNLAQNRLDEFDKFCDDCINGSDKEVKRQLWNRSHMKARKLAALVAIGCNTYNPQVTVDMVTWAIELVTRDCNSLLGKFDAGEIGTENTETSQLKKLIGVLKDYIELDWKDVLPYAAPNQYKLQAKGIIPYSYIQRRLVGIAAFRKDRLGSTSSIKRTISTLIERGDVVELNRSQQKENGTKSKCYMIVNTEILG